MFRKTHTLAVAALALAALTGCGGADAEARGSHTYEPLPPLSTATPSPTPKAISSPSPKDSSTPSPTPSASPTEMPESGVMAAGAPDPASGQGAVGGPAPALAPAPAPAPAPVPAPVSGPVGGGAPGQMTERTSSSTTTVTSTTLEARVQIVVTCEGLCVLNDLSGPELTGGDGPVSPDLLRQALGGQGGDQQRLTDELIEQLTKGDWDLTDTTVQGGDEKLVFSSARK